jgi:hypothetical protein
MTEVTIRTVKATTINLPIKLVCKKTGYMDTHIGLHRMEKGDRFCERGACYDLVAYDGDSEEHPDNGFEMKTETWLDDDEVILTSHYMSYEFLTEFFHVHF